MLCVKTTSETHLRDLWLRCPFVWVFLPVQSVCKFFPLILKFRFPWGSSSRPPLSSSLPPLSSSWALGWCGLSRRPAASSTWSSSLGTFRSCWGNRTEPTMQRKVSSWQSVWLKEPGTATTAGLCWNSYPRGCWWRQVKMTGFSAAMCFRSVSWKRGRVSQSYVFNLCGAPAGWSSLLLTERSTQASCAWSCWISYEMVWRGDSLRRCVWCSDHIAGQLTLVEFSMILSKLLNFRCYIIIFEDWANRTRKQAFRKTHAKTSSRA